MATIPENYNNIRAGIVELLKTARSAAARNVNARAPKREAAEAHYALDNLPNKVLAAEYHTVLPNEKLIAEELERSSRELRKRVCVSRVQRESPNLRPRNKAR